MAGRWTKAVKDAHKLHVKNVPDVSPYAQYLYGVLSSEIHGSPWISNAVQFSDSLDDQETVHGGALQGNGLDHQKKVGPVVASL